MAKIFTTSATKIGRHENYGGKYRKGRSGDRGEEYKDEYLDFMASPQGLLAFQYGAREFFFAGGRGSVCFERESHLKALHFISTKKVCFCAKGSFPRRRHISTAEVYFYGERNISTADAHFYGGGVFLRGGVSLRRKCISMKEVNLKAISL